MLAIVLSAMEEPGTVPSTTAEVLASFTDRLIGRLGTLGGGGVEQARAALRALAGYLAATHVVSFSRDDPEVRAELRAVGLRGREVPVFLDRAAEVGLLREAAEGVYQFTHALVLDHLAGRA